MNVSSVKEPQTGPVQLRNPRERENRAREKEMAGKRIYERTSKQSISTNRSGPLQ